MSIENLSQLEERIQAAIDTIGLQKLELDEVREEKIRLEEENQRLKVEIQDWNTRIQTLLGRFEQISEEAEAEA